MVKISVSLLSMRDDLKEKVKKVNGTSADYFHLDIMDGKFTPHDSYSYDEIKTIVSNARKPFDVHLMVDNISKYISEYAMYETEYITIHYEAMLDTNVIKKIKSYGIKCGIAINPKTDVELIYDLLDKIDLVLVMSVEPGLGGQAFIESSLDKVRKLREEISKRKINVKISMDGGINNTNIGYCINSGVDMVVIGSYLNKCNDLNNTIEILKNDE